MSDGVIVSKNEGADTYGIVITRGDSVRRIDRSSAEIRTMIAREGLTLQRLSLQLREADMDGTDTTGLMAAVITSQGMSAELAAIAASMKMGG